MPGKRISDAGKRQFWALIGQGISAPQAAAQIGASRTWAWRQVNGVAPSKSLVERERLEAAQPAPKSFDELDGGVKDTLRFDGGFTRFCEAFLLRTPLPWREDAARRVVEALQDRSKRDFIVANMPPGSGKALALDTPLPTPSGWTTMKEVEPGDELFGADGRPCRVVAVSEVFYGHDCYEVRTSDGASVIADAGHQWPSDGSLRTTAELSRSGGHPFIVTPFESVPTRCVQVSAPDGLYLAGEGMMVTHNSTLFTMDIPAWLIAGGGLEDPIRGRAIRTMLGSFGMTTATHYVRRLRQFLESPRPFFDKESHTEAELSLVQAFGRFKPRQQGIPWRESEFIVEQFGEIDLTEKEPTVQAASREKGFLGERVELFSWDDLVVSANVRNRDVRDALAEWFSDEAETRLEPGGVGLLVGQRLGPDDLYRNRVDVTYVDEVGVQRRKYQHIVYPAHSEETCDGAHRQWDSAAEGCLLDEVRLPWNELEANRQSNPRKYRVLYQQEDVDPAGALIDEAWLQGGTDRDGMLVPGCFDEDRAFLEWPAGVTGLVDYVTVDPSAGNYWGLLWWAIHPTTKTRYLIRGLRSSSFKAGDLLQFDVDRGVLSGAMQSWQQLSVELHHPIKVWVIEGNSAFKHLTQYDHFRVWQRQWKVGVILHKTGLNKNDTQTGVEALLPELYRQGLKRIPRKQQDSETFRFSEAMKKELTQYPDGATTDLVMADWMSEWNLAAILAHTRRPAEARTSDLKLPPYLMKRRVVADMSA